MNNELANKQGLVTNSWKNS